MQTRKVTPQRSQILPQLWCNMDLVATPFVSVQCVDLFGDLTLRSPGKPGVLVPLRIPQPWTSEYNSAGEFILLV